MNIENLSWAIHEMKMDFYNKLICFLIKRTHIYSSTIYTLLPHVSIPSLRLCIESYEKHQKEKKNEHY